MTKRLRRLRRRVRAHSPCEEVCDLSLLKPIKGEPPVGTLLDELRAREKNMGFYGTKLVHRVREELNIDLPDDVRISPCRPGEATRSAGGFSWFFESEKFLVQCVGSQFTVRECAMASSLSTTQEGFDIFLFPES